MPPPALAYLLVVLLSTSHLLFTYLLLEWGADLNNVSNIGRTAIHWAAFQGHKDVIRLLLDRGAHPKEVDHNGDTALSLALGRTGVITRDHKDIVNMLKDPRT